MGKWLFLAFIFFAWFVAPPLFRAMTAHDYNTAANGFRITDGDE